MSPSGIRFLPYAIAALPFALVAAASALWWGSLARPWAYLLVGNVVLYGLIALVVVVGNRFVIGGYFLETKPPGSTESRAPIVDSFTLIVLAAVLVFVAISGSILWGLKLWLAKP
jgi:hypothetical protein